MGAIAALAIVAGVAALGGRNADMPVVSVARAHLGPLETWVVTNGIIEPVDAHIIRAPVATFVQGVDVPEGSAVERGDRLLTLDVASQRADLAQARAELARAENALRIAAQGGPAGDALQLDVDLRSSEADLAHLLRERDATERLVAKNAATSVELEQSELALSRVQGARDVLVVKQGERARRRDADVKLAELERARASETVRLLEAQVQFADVRAPTAGTAYRVPVRSGARVEVGGVLAEIADLSKIQLRAFVDEPDLGSVAEGERVEVSWSGLPGRSWTGTTVRAPKTIVARGDRAVGEVVCAIDNTDQRLLPNLGVDVRIRVQHREEALLVPREAVRGDETGRYVFVVDSDVVRRRPVVVGAGNPSTYPVVGGLTDGDRVVLSAAPDLRDGIRVRSLPAR